MAVADLDGDKNPDLVVANWLGDNVSVVMNGGEGSFMAGVSLSCGIAPSSVEVSDIDRDGIPDIVAANGDEGNVVVLYGEGNGTFRPWRELGTWDSPHSLDVADIDGDGWSELVVAYGYSPDASVVKGARRYNLDVDVPLPGLGSVRPVRGSYTSGTEVSVTAMPAPGVRFLGWEGPVTDTVSAETTIIIEEDELVRAAFEPE